ncbi:hypothetical protein D3C83_230620 [compost metagenome]
MVDDNDRPTGEPVAEPGQRRSEFIGDYSQQADGETKRHYDKTDQRDDQRIRDETGEREVAEIVRD